MPPPRLLRTPTFTIWQSAWQTLSISFSPEVIGLSGGVANQGENLLKPLRAAAAPMVFGSAFAKKHTRITTCTLGYRAGVIGAALLAKQEV